MFGDFALMHAHSVNSFELDFPASRRDPKKGPTVRPVIGLEGRHQLAFGGLPMNDRVEVGKGLPKCLVETTYARLVGGHVELRRVVNEVVGEEFLKELEIPRTLHL